MTWRPDDAVVLGMKTQDTAAALTTWPLWLRRRVTIVCAQNGVENERLALRRFADVKGMCVMLPAAHMEPGRVEAYGRPLTGLLDVGVYPAGRDATSERIAKDLEASAFSSTASDDMMR